MKRTTAGGIGILCAALAVGTGLFFQTGGIGHVTDLAGKMTEEYIRQNGENEAVPADASGEGGYLLTEEEGMVVVYRSNSHELYEKTGIPVESLPGEVQKELSEGKTVKDNMELYGFLENYSS